VLRSSLVGTPLCPTVDRGKAESSPMVNSRWHRVWGRGKGIGQAYPAHIWRHPELIQSAITVESNPLDCRQMAAAKIEIDFRYLGRSLSITELITRLRGSDQTIIFFQLQFGQTRMSKAPPSSCISW